MLAYQNMEGYGQGLLLYFRALTKAFFDLQVLVVEGVEIGLSRRGGFNLEEEVSTWAHILEDESTQLAHSNLTSPDSTFN